MTVHLHQLARKLTSAMVDHLKVPSENHRAPPFAVPRLLVLIPSSHPIGFLPVSVGSVSLTFGASFSLERFAAPLPFASPSTIAHFVQDIMSNHIKEPYWGEEKLVIGIDVGTTGCEYSKPLLIYAPLISC